MAKPPDPFAGVKLSDQVGLDQRLFQERPSTQSEPPSERTSVRKDEGTSQAKDDRTSEPLVVLKQDRPEMRKQDRPKGHPSRRSAKHTTVREVKVERIVEHRPYDFFQDQVRWLNRKKVELEEEYGERVPATAMVQLAVDLLIADYEANKENSQLIKVLIDEERPSVRPFGPSEDATRSGGEGGRDG